MRGFTSTAPSLPWIHGHGSPGESGNRRAGVDSGGSSALHSAQVHIGRLRVADTILNNVRFELAEQGHYREAKPRAREFASKVTVPHHARRNRSGS